METVISSFRPTARIDDPGILEGGDVLRIGREVFVGCATRSCEEGINQLRSHLQPFGYVVKAIHHGDALHLKTACTYLGEGVLLVNPEWVDVEDFPDFEVLECDPLEPFACNAIRLGAKVLFPGEFPRTRERLEQRGFTVHPVPASELAKAEGGLTCSSVIFDENERGAGETPGG